MWLTEKVVVTSNKIYRLIPLCVSVLCSHFFMIWNILYSRNCLICYSIASFYLELPIIFLNSRDSMTLLGTCEPIFYLIKFSWLEPWRFSSEKWNFRGVICFFANFYHVSKFRFFLWQKLPTDMNSVSLTYSERFHFVSPMSHRIWGSYLWTCFWWLISSLKVHN